MKTCAQMKDVVESLAHKHGVDLSQVGSLLVLDMPSYMRLYIETFTTRRVAVAHYFAMNGDLVPDPRMVFFVTQTNQWVPIGIAESMRGPSSYVKMSADGQDIEAYDEDGQAKLADFAVNWAEQIVSQGWLEEATCVQSSLASANMARSCWPDPTTDAPDMDMIFEWLLMDGDCEATDGCFVEPDGVCPHGHPSWLIQLKMI